MGLLGRLRYLLHPVEARIGRAAPVVVLFHLGRSGSTVLGRMLARHPGVHWLGEIYEAAPGVPSRWSTSFLHPDRPIPYLRAMLARAHGRVLGIEVKPRHLRRAGISLEDFVQAAGRLGVTHYAVLERQNLLRVVVSSVVARHRSRYHYQRGEEVTLTRIELDCQGLLQRLDEYRASLQALREVLQPLSPLWLTYEDDVRSDPGRALRRMQSFLELPQLDVAPELRRSTPFPLRQILTNHEEVRAHLAGSPYAPLLDLDDYGDGKKAGRPNPSGCS